MQDYPPTLAELEQRFATESACRDYLTKLRWPGGIVCPRCEERRGRIEAGGRWVCAACRRRVSVTAGTIFHGHHQSLRLWLRAIWLVASQEGVSAETLQQELGLGSYRSASRWLQTLREAMARDNRGPLSVEVDVGDARLRVAHGGPRGTRDMRDVVIAIAVEKGTGRTRLRRIRDRSQASLHAFVCEVVAAESRSAVRTDDWEGYAHLERHGYDHRVEREKESESRMSGKEGYLYRLPSPWPRLPSRALPRVRRVAEDLTIWLFTFHREISASHLGSYLDEFTFRRNCDTRRSRWKRLLKLALGLEHV